MMENEPPLLPADADESNSDDAQLVPTPPSLPVEEIGENITAPLLTVASVAEAVLRQPKRIFHRIGQPDGKSLALRLLFISILGLLGYGFVVGTFTGGQQLWAAPVKVAGGILVSGLICLPSLYIFSCLAGSKATLQQILGLVAGLMAIMTFLLIGFAPVAWVFSQSTESIPMMGLLHLLFWTVAMYFAIAFFKSGFQAVVAESDNGVVKVWLTVFVVVVLQMSTALRPIIGESETFLPTEKKFFVGHWGDTMTDESRRSRATHDD
ncbi:MAG: hypothetical protein ACPGVU_25570 [Limisphaerales bacterium]